MTLLERRQYVLDNFDVNPVYAYWVAGKMPADKKSATLQTLKQIHDEKPKPFVKWVGGKRQLLSQFKNNGLYPPESFNPLYNTYYEPFVGGGAVFFDLLPKEAV